MKTVIRKLTSRKLWAAAAGLAVGIAIIFGVDEGTISTISGAMASVLSVMAYIITEGKIDAANVYQVAESVETIVEAVRGTEGNEFDEAEEMEDENDV